MATPSANGTVKRKPAAEVTDKTRAIEKKKCVTHEFRVSFPKLFEAESFKGGEAKYSVTMLFPKNTDLGTPAGGQKNSLKAAALNALTETWGTKDKWPKGLRLPFRDGSEKEEMQGYEDTIFVYASSKKRPGVVGPSLQPILNEEDIYAGCYARAEVIAFTYDTAGNKGVSFSLQNIQKLRDGEPFSGRRDASQVFDAVEDVSSESPENYETDQLAGL